MKKDEKIMSYVSIYAVILGLLGVVALWVFLICTPPILIALNKQNWVLAFEVCYPVAVILLPLVVFGIYAGHQYIKGEIEELKVVK